MIGFWPAAMCIIEDTVERFFRVGNNSFTVGLLQKLIQWYQKNRQRKLEKSQMRIHYKNVQAGITAMALRLPDLEPLEDQFLDHKRDCIKEAAASSNHGESRIRSSATFQRWHKTYDNGRKHC
eukprot:CAMPEP_0181460370 /NCGR_PEP_ID=MMETSP1110-20121109/33305_1 /TAXON_ID=174948 /ORGANISM="Symbiodinium sp., Strain CCMP421" /LENGTH=122 /DNA_ID=CAMNT_0023584917 /DNA_START=306 /DNA_END=674 /DNA_ORIENTATION=-